MSDAWVLWGSWFVNTNPSCSNTPVEDEGFSLIVDLCRQVIKIWMDFYYRSQTDYALNELLMTIIIPMFFSEYLES